MCGRIIQSSGPLRLAIIEGLDVSDSRLGNIPRRYNAALRLFLFRKRVSPSIGAQLGSLSNFGRRSCCSALLTD
jgi:hypothetical protein